MGEIFGVLSNLDNVTKMFYINSTVINNIKINVNKSKNLGASGIFELNLPQNQVQNI